eukprot:3055407-Pyramimonas_sp.AAC.1
MSPRATCVRSMLTPRPPAREFLKRGPPAPLRKAPREFNERAVSSKAAAEQLATAGLCASLPPERGRDWLDTFRRGARPCRPRRQWRRGKSISPGREVGE